MFDFVRKRNLSNMKKYSVFFLLLVLLAVVPTAMAKPIKAVVLDAGHGGNDPGAIGFTGKQEKNVSLAIVLKLGAMIEKNYPDIKVIYTRKTDVFVDLYRRAQIANENNADLFISIHCNSSTSPSSYGTETFVMGTAKNAANLAVAQKENASILLEANAGENYGNFDPSSPEAYIIFSLYQNAYLEQSSKLASDIQHEFTNTLHRFDRGVKQAGFLVLWKTAMPSILIETGFISNKEEEIYLTSEKGQNELTKAIFDGYSKMVEENKKPVVVKHDEVIDLKPVEIADQSTAKVTYKVQIATLNEKKDSTDYAFRKVRDFGVIQIGNKYCYTSGHTHTYAEILPYLEYVKENGFKDAFIVAYDNNNNRISVSEARKLE